MKTNTFRLTRITVTILTFFLICAVGTAWGQDGNANQEAVVWNVGEKDLEWGGCPAFMPDDCRIAVLQGNPAQPNADVFFKLQGNTSVPKHWHHSPERMVLISGEMKVKYDGQDSKVMNAGNYAYGPAERRHSAACISDEPCVLFIAFENPIDAMPVSKAGTN